MLSKKFISNITKLLQDEKSDLLKKSASRPDIDGEGDETDTIQANIIIDLQLQFAGINNQKLAAIEESLRRIENGTYGKCADCDEEIPEKRLLINPHFLTCISCAEEREQEEKQKKR